MAQIEIWWRDDDAIDVTPNLKRLLELRARWGLPMAMAVVPRNAKPSLFDLLNDSDIDVLVHGYAHLDHSLSGERKAEFCSHRDLAAMRTELKSGLQKLRELHPQTLPVFVPPWNRMPEGLVHELPDFGFCGASAWEAKNDWPRTPRLRVEHANLDVIDWRSGARAKTTSELLQEIETLTNRGRRIGVLTHHLQMSEASFASFEALFEALSVNPAIVWTSASRIFCESV